MTLKFSDFLTPLQLTKVNYYSYFPVIEEVKNGVATCRILPSDDAVSYVIEFEKESKRLISGEINWFNEPLYKNYSTAKIFPAEKTSVEFSSDLKENCIVLNLLDFCYGHSFVKMLNVIDFYKEYSKTHDIVVISFGYIHDFLPTEKFQIIKLDMSFSQAQAAPNLENIINELRNKYKTVDFAVLDAYKRFEDKKELLDFFNFFGKIKDPYQGRKIITFNYRKGISRSWGGLNQAKNVIKFFSELKSYFKEDVIFCVIGEKDKYVFPSWVLDKRIEKFPNPILHEYHYILKNSIFTVGLLGSHMLSASVLSEMTIHLTSETFLRVAATDIVNHKTFASSSYFEHVYLEGNATLSNYKPKSLAYKIMLLFLGKISLEYKEKCLDLLKEHGKVELQKDFIAKQHSYFKLREFSDLKERNDNKHNKLIQIQTYISKIKSIL